MRPRRSILAGALIAGSLSLVGSSSFAAPESHPIPHELQAEHARILEHLRALSHRSNAIGTAAQHVVALLAPHDQREQEFVLPLLGVLEPLATKGADSRMAWAIPMADRLETEKAALYDEHAAIIGALNELAAAGRRQHDRSVVQFAEAVASDEVNDGSVIYPAAILVGRYIREHLPAAR